MKWRGERHTDLKLSTDASSFAWGACLPDETCCSDLWETGDNRPIHLKETEALFRTLKTFPDKLRNRRVDVQVDNQALVEAWNNQRSKDGELLKLLKNIFQWVSSVNCDLKLVYVPSGENLADTPSRRLSAVDMKLSDTSWKMIEAWFGPHTFDLMALDSNAVTGRDGKALPHFSPWPLPFSSGVNIFSQSLNGSENYYCFPPFAMTGSVLAFLLSECSRPLQVTMVVPKLSPPGPWWPKFLANADSIHTLGVKGDIGIVEIPSKKGFTPTATHHDLLVGRLQLT